MVRFSEVVKVHQRAHIAHTKACSVASDHNHLARDLRCLKIACLVRTLPHTVGWFLHRCTGVLATITRQDVEGQSTGPWRRAEATTWARFCRCSFIRLLRSPGAPERDRQRSPRASDMPRHVTRRCFCRYAHTDMRPSPWRRSDLQMTAHRGRALPHHGQPEVGRALLSRTAGSKPSPSSSTSTMT